ncbi:MAG: PGN_0703 family putative restriction endonuclease [Thermodesulfobacteriota bacterium]
MPDRALPTNYCQFFREVLFAFAKGGTFVLLHDERNPAFFRTSADGTTQCGLWPFLLESIPPILRRRVGRLTVQGLVQAIVESGRHGDWIHDFQDKFGL